jgi:hypothetical protein
MGMWFRIFLVAVLSSCAFAQQTKKPVPHVDDDFVHEQFGASCALDPQFVPLTADLNGDGVEDLVLVARCKNALIDQDEKNYRVIDPMNAFYGYGNPRVTSSMGQADPRLKGISLLVIHGAGADAWRSAKPGEKFVVINLEIKTVTVRKMKISKKKSTPAIYVEESTGDEMTSAIYWDGKKYKYEPLGSGTE